MIIIIVILLLTILYFFPTKKITSHFQNNSKQETVSSVSALAPTDQIASVKKKEDVEGELKRVFSTFDKNGDGVITKQELKDALKGIGMAMEEEEVEEMVQKLDVNGDGLIDANEFESMVRINDGDEELKEAFDVFDGDGDGLITVEELRMVLSSLGLKEGKKVEDCVDMIRKVDLDGDGMVNFGEFKKMMMMKPGLFC